MYVKDIAHNRPKISFTAENVQNVQQPCCGVPWGGYQLLPVSDKRTVFHYHYKCSDFI